MTKPLAKSLHTVTVLVAMGRVYMGRDILLSPHHCVARAIAVLGLYGAPDAYGLADKAAAILSKGAR